MIPLWGLMFLGASPGVPKARTSTIFLALAALWTLGQGMHLAANSVGHLTRVDPGSDVHRLVDFFDEKLGHWLWHGATFALTTLLLAREAIHGSAHATGPRLGWLASVIYGITIFIIVVEGQTGWIGVPFSVGVALFAWRVLGKHAEPRPMLRFFGLAYAIAAVLFAAWGAYWRGLPEFSEVGIID